MKPIAYRPSVVPTKALCEAIAAADAANFFPPLRIDWRSGGRFGISTDDLAVALAWMAEARNQGQTPRLPAPIRRVVERNHGSSRLECGHICNTPPRRTLSVRCPTCLPPDERREWFKFTKKNSQFPSRSV